MEKENNETKDLKAVENNFSSLTETGEYEPAVSMEELLEDAAGIQIEFSKIVTPSGGSIAFEIADAATGEVDTRKFIEGVIVDYVPVNVYYEGEYTGQSEDKVPQCISYGGIVGTDSEGNEKECKDCEFYKYGSGKNGAKACKARRNILILLNGEVMPRQMNLPTGSIKAFSKLQTWCLMSKKRLRDVVVKVALVKEVNTTGIAYSSHQFVIIGRADQLPAEQWENVQNASRLVQIMKAR